MCPMNGSKRNEIIISSIHFMSIIRLANSFRARRKSEQLQEKWLHFRRMFSIFSAFFYD